MHGPRRCASVLAAGALLLATLTTCSRETSRDAACAPCAPVLLYAVDGLEWSVMMPLIEQGRMPVMAGLMQRGTYGYLETIEPTWSPVIWTTMATGKLPKDHGIEGFTYRVGPGDEGLRFYTSGHRATKAFWNILSDYNRTVNCLGWWMTYPAEPIHGVMVAQTNTTAVLHNSENALLKGTVLRGVEDQVYPPARQDAVMDILDHTDSTFDSMLTAIFGGIPKATTEFTRVLWEQSQWAFRADAVYLAVAKQLLESGPFDMTAVYVGGTDVAAHRFWQYTYPQQFRNPPDAGEIASFGKVLPDYYAYIDRALGELIAAAPENTTVIVVSDHGNHAVNIDHEFTLSDDPEMRLSGNHMDAPPGVLIAAGPNIALRAGNGALSPPDASRPVGHAFDMLPTLLALQGIPAGEDFIGKPMTAVIDPEFLKQMPVRTVRTHDDQAWDEARQARIKEAADRAERLEQLRSLGYIK